MKICPVGAEMFHTDSRTGRQDEANSRFSQFCDRAQKFSIKKHKSTRKAKRGQLTNT